MMRAWQLERLGGFLELKNVPVPEPRPGSVVVRVETSSLMSYMKGYVEGKLPIYSPPKGYFVPGGNAVGVIHAVGRDVWHLKANQRVVVLLEKCQGRCHLYQRDGHYRLLSDESTILQARQVPRQPGLFWGMLRRGQEARNACCRAYEPRPELG